MTPPSPRALAWGWRLLRASIHPWIRHATLAFILLLTLVGVPLVMSTLQTPTPPGAEGIRQVLAITLALFLPLAALCWLPEVIGHTLLRRHPAWRACTTPDEQERAARLRALLGEAHAVACATAYAMMEAYPDVAPEGQAARASYRLREATFQTPRMRQRYWRFFSPTHHRMLQRALFVALARQHGVPAALTLCAQPFYLHSPRAPSAHLRLQSQAWLRAAQA